MKCPSAQDLQDYMGGRTLPPNVTEQIQQHLDTCGKCQQYAADVRLANAAFSWWLNEGVVHGPSTQDCLSEMGMHALINGKVGRREKRKLLTHIEGCPLCLDWWSTTVSGIASLEANGVSSEGSQAFSRRRFVAGVLVGVAVAAALAVLLVFWTAIRPLQTQVADLRVQLQRIAEENRRTHQDYITAITTIRKLETQLATLKDQQTSSPLITLALKDGGEQVTLDQQGNLRGLTSLSPSLRGEVKMALMTQRVKKPPVLAKVTGERGSLMGTSGSGLPFAPRSPVGKVILTDRPTFSWKPLPEATSYTVEIVRDTDHKRQAVSESLPATVTKWTLTKKEKPLPAGVYRWYVAATLKDGTEVTSPEPPAPLAKFKVLDQKRREELEHAKKTYKSHLTLGLLYVEAGLLDDAEREFEALLDANPKSQVSQKLLQSVRALQPPNSYLPSPTKTKPAQ